MTARKSSITNALTKGVLDPALSERMDLAHYYNGLADGLNLEMTPQGGARRRGGSNVLSDWDYTSLGYKSRKRFRIDPVNVTAAMVTVSNGGTKANLLDQSSATALVTNTVAGTTWVIAEIDLGAAMPVCFFDVIGFKAATGTWRNSLAVEYYDGAAWQPLAGAADPEDSPRKAIAATSRTRRFGEWPGGDMGVPVSARTWRIVAYNVVGAGAITVQGIRLWTEKRQISPVKGLSFARAADLVYEMVLTDRNVDVFRDHKYVASIPVDIDARQIHEVTFVQSLDTLFLFHEDVQTIRITRQGANDEWNSEAVTFTNVPNLTAGTAFSGSQDEVQEVSISGLAAGQTFVLWLGDKATAPITYAPSTFAADIEAALEAIGVGSGLEVTRLATVAPGVRLTFTGNAGSRRWPVVAATVLGVDTIEAVTTVLQRGIDATSTIMGATTGWPRCGALYQERFILGGFRGAPMTLGFSVFGDEFDFLDTSSPMTADLAFFITLNTDLLETIQHAHIGKDIQIFTDAGEWYVETRSLDATQPVNVRLATRYRIRREVPPLFANGSTLFLQHGGRVLRDMTFSDVELSYTAEPLSLLAPHLLRDVVSMAHRPQRGTDEGNQVFMVNSGGDLAFMSLLKTQEVVAVVPWETDGKFRGAFADSQSRVWMFVERETLTGGPELYLEDLDGSHSLDAAITYDRGGVTASVITGLGIHEGKQVWAWADGDLVGPFTVTSGQITLAKPASVVTVGLFPNVRGRLPSLREKLQNERPWRPPVRVTEIEMSLAGTGQLDISVNGGPFRPVKLPFGKDERALDIGLDRPRDTSGVSTGTAAETPMERLAQAVTMIPSAGEFVYGTEVVETDLGGGDSLLENMHNETGASDFTLSLGQAAQALPKLKNMSLFVAWFGDDLRCNSCDIKPGVEQASKTTSPYSWSVQGIARGDAYVVSETGSRPSYGGTPADRSVKEAIAAMKAQGVAVTLTPFLLMDIPAGNSLTDPYDGSSGQPEFPWRGRVTVTPAPGQPSTPDLTSTAATQIAAFVGACETSDFAISGGDVVYSGPAEWSYRRFILHYAFLAKAAGGVDTFVIGSEMRGLTWVRSALGVYPFVAALQQLASDVKAVLGTDTKVTYAADWSEYFGHQTGIAGEIFFHLDPLWASPYIDAIGIDCYWPLSDWRDGMDHLDYAEASSIYDRAYLQRNVAGGEGYDWFYASSGDRTNQVRTPITDNDYGKPWVWRYKDVRNWWANAHHNRPAGVEDAAATGWVPQSKPVWFMEVGCPAIDKGANQPNVFYDPKSSESAIPYFSAGVSDPAMQRAYNEAMLAYWTPGQSAITGDNNPVSAVYGGRMVDASRLYLYTWDARFHPAFPDLVDVWADGDLWEFGHWLTGRVEVTVSVERDSLPVGLDATLPMRQRLITGRIRITNLRGFSRHPKIEFSQSSPAPLEIRAIRYDVVHN